MNESNPNCSQEDLKTSLSELQQKMVELEKMKQNYTDTSAHIEVRVIGPTTLGPC